MFGGRTECRIRRTKGPSVLVTLGEDPVEMNVSKGFTKGTSAHSKISVNAR